MNNLNNLLEKLNKHKYQDKIRKKIIYTINFKDYYENIKEILNLEDYKMFLTLNFKNCNWQSMRSKIISNVIDFHCNIINTIDSKNFNREFKKIRYISKMRLDVFSKTYEIFNYIKYLIIEHFKDNNILMDMDILNSNIFNYNPNDDQFMFFAKYKYHFNTEQLGTLRIILGMSSVYELAKIYNFNNFNFLDLKIEI